MSRGHQNIIVVTGISASGKDFLLDRALAGQSKDTATILAFGSLLFERLRVRGGSADSRDDLRSAPASLVAMCAREIIDEAIATPGLKIINTHVAYKSGEFIMVNPALVSIVRPSCYMFIKAKPSVIAGRRQADANRRRDKEGFDTIALHQEIALSVVAGIARAHNTEFLVIDNHEENIDQNIIAMQEIIYG